MYLTEKLRNFALYELGNPIIQRMGHNYVQAELNLKERKYSEALKYAGKTIFHTIQEGMWLGMSVLEVGALGGIANGISSGNLKQAAMGSGAIALMELIKYIMNNPQRYSIVRPHKIGTT